MDKLQAQKTLATHYRTSYLAPACTECEGDLLGDVLKYDFNLKAAAIKLDVLISEVDLHGQSGEKEQALLLKHNKDLTPISHCGHGEKCCLKGTR